MDPVLSPSLIAAALKKLLNSAAADAGSKAWDALKDLLARHRHAEPSPPATPDEADALAEQLATAAAQNPALARDLDAWQISVSGSGNVANTVTGQVERLVQGRDFSNSPITFH